MAIFVGEMLVKKNETPCFQGVSAFFHYSSSMQVSIYGFSHKKHTQHIVVKSIHSYYSAPFLNLLGTFWEHSFSLPHLRIKASWMDYLNRKSLYTYLCNKMSIQLSKNSTCILYRKSNLLSLSLYICPFRFFNTAIDIMTMQKHFKIC